MFVQANLYNFIWGSRILYILTGYVFIRVGELSHVVYRLGRNQYRDKYMPYKYRRNQFMNMRPPFALPELLPLLLLPWLLLADEVAPPQH